MAIGDQRKIKCINQMYMHHIFVESGIIPVIFVLTLYLSLSLALVFSLFYPRQ